MINVDAAIRRAVGNSGEPVHCVRFFPDHGVYAVRTFDARDRDDQGRLWTYVAMNDARIVGTRHNNGTIAGAGSLPGNIRSIRERRCALQAA